MPLVFKFKILPPWQSPVKINAKEVIGELAKKIKNKTELYYLIIFTKHLKNKIYEICTRCFIYY